MERGRRSLEGDVFGIAIHAAHIAVNNFTVVGTERSERHAGHFGKGFGGIESAEGRPVVVGAQVDVFCGMFAEGGVDVDGFHAGIEKGVGGANVGVLRARNAARFVRAIVFDGGGNEHAIDVHAGESGVVEVGGAGVADAALATAAEGHKGTDIFPTAGDDDAGVGDLGVVVGREVVVIGLDVGIREVGVVLV